MASSSARTFVNDLTIFISKAAKDRRTNLQTITIYICALFNSGGSGRLTLKCEEQTDVDDLLRMIEQRVRTLVSYRTFLKIDTSTTLSEIVMLINSVGRVVTLDYHAYLPGTRQFLPLAPGVADETVMDILRRRIDLAECTQMRTHCKDFFQGRLVCLVESVQCRFADMKVSKDKGLGNRVLHRYISAFGNSLGGHVYFGISQNGLVEGVRITEDDKNDVTCEVTKIIHRMLWPSLVDLPKKGSQWDVFFEPVKNSGGEIIPALYVVVLFIAPCPGGVFTQEPDSYHVVNGEVAKMEFSTWMSCLTAGKLSI